MPDLFDKAAETADFYLDLELKKRKTFDGESATECVECGEIIPKRRRELLQGVKTCVDCQEYLEAMKRD